MTRELKLHQVILVAQAFSLHQDPKQVAETGLRRTAADLHPDSADHADSL